ncbi:MAG TPA: hypothetical protein VNT56_11955 [Acidimicrobiales bacterium]|nr:hypothetical protein [Acidimicrobiales bacterium]
MTSDSSIRNLFGEESSQPPAQRHSATSRLAAERAAPRAGTLGPAVLGVLREPHTDDAGAERLGISLNSWRPRRVEWVRKGAVVRVGTGRSAAGNPAALWQAKDHVPKDADDTGVPAPVWQAAVDRRPAWMSRAQHERLIQEALAAHNGNTRAALEQVAADLEALR